MDQLAALRVIEREGRVPTLAAPIPDLAVVDLPSLFAVTVREWCAVRSDGRTLDLCGHTFHVAGWTAQTARETGPGLVIEHACVGHD